MSLYQESPTSPKPFACNQPQTPMTYHLHGNTGRQENMQQSQSADLHSNNNNSRLPGLIAYSQPNTPRPGNIDIQQDQYTARPLPVRPPLRGRASSYSAETGPTFSSTRSFENLFSADKQELVTPIIQARMDRGFFMADEEWTCYRRNYFQVSSVFSLQNQYMNEHDICVKSNDAYYPVKRFFIGISAAVRSSAKEVELVQHTAKRDKGPQFKPAPKPTSQGGNLNFCSTLTTNGTIAIFERIQFKTATANNGKRRAAQQYYVCFVSLYAETDRFGLIKVATCQSAPLVVRGRSPGHYADSPKARHIKHLEHPTETPIYGDYSKPQDIMPSPYYYAPQYPVPASPLSQAPGYSHPYGQEDTYDQSNAPTPKLQHYVTQNMGEFHDWQRARYNSASSGSSSVPSPQPHEQPHYFAQHDHRSYSPTTPTYPPLQQ